MSGRTGTFDLRPGVVVRLGPADAGALAKVERRIDAFGDAPSRVELIGLEDNQPRFMTDVMLGEAMRLGEFAVVMDEHGKALPVVLSPLDLDERQGADAARRNAYVTACETAREEPEAPIPRSRKLLMPLIRATAEERGEAAPGFSTVLTWIDRVREKSDGSGRNAALAFPRNQGNRQARVVKGKVGDAVASAIVVARRRRLTGEKARELVEEYLKSKHPDVAASLALPSVRTMSRRISGLDRFTGDALRYGPKTAERKHRGAYQGPRPEHPLMEVECDHTPGDVLLCSNDGTVIFGRSDIVSFRDRCTGACLGLGIGFDAPSYASFLEGLRHAFYPKDMRAYPNVQNPWVEFGRPLKLFVDNALHFTGHNIRHASAQLNIGIVEFQPGQPWMKGGEERMLGDLNRAVSHRLPGSTFSNPADKRRYKELAEMPIVTVGEYRAAMHGYVCDHFNVEPHEGLGMLPTLRDVPRRLWDEKIQPMAPLPNEDLFVQLAGDVDHRSITGKGISWENVRYRSDAIDFLATRPGHVPGREAEEGRRGPRHRGTRYKVTRNPHNLGSVWVHNPHPEGPRTFRIPAVRPDYAEGLTLHQHRKLVEAADERTLRWMEEPENKLLQVKRAFPDVVMRELLDGRLRDKVDRQLARFVELGQYRHQQAQTAGAMTDTALSASLADPFAPDDPPVAGPPAASSPDSSHVNPTAPPKTGGKKAPKGVAAHLANAVARSRNREGRSDPATDVRAARERRRVAGAGPGGHGRPAEAAEPVPKADGEDVELAEFRRRRGIDGDGT